VQFKLTRACLVWKSGGIGLDLATEAETAKAEPENIRAYSCGNGLRKNCGPDLLK